MDCGGRGRAAALAAREPLALYLHGIDQLGLPARSGGESGIERTGVAEAATGHFGNLGVVAGIERGEAAAPAQCLGMVRVALLPLRQDRPDRVELAVLAQQMPIAQASGLQIPDAHRSMVALEGAVALPPPAEPVRLQLRGGHAVLAAGAGPGAGKGGQLVDRGEADEAVDDPAHGVRLAEVETDERRDEVKLCDRDQAPIQAADHDQRGGEDVELLHEGLLP